MRGKPKDIAASVRQRLLNQARERNEDFTYTLVNYGIERLLYRLSQSDYQSRLILKGATLFAVWTGMTHRPTRDVDFLSYGQVSSMEVNRLFTEIISISCEDDGLQFLRDTIKVTDIRENEIYRGLRVTLTCQLGSAKIPLQADIGFGDVITPPPVEISLPSLLGLPEAVLLSYPMEAVVAEKFEALVKLAMANTRMKDFFDLYFMANSFAFESDRLSSSLKATFDRRGTLLPADLPIALTRAFWESSEKNDQWQAFLRRTRLLEPGLSLQTVCLRIGDFLIPIFQKSNDDASRLWTPELGWHQPEQV